MTSDELGTWQPLDVTEVAALFGDAGFRWWIGGGRALELHVGRSWRQHGDTDVGVTRRDLGAVREVLGDWDVHVAASGRLRPWRGGALDPARHENNLWCRRSADAPWALDVTIGAGDATAWAYRRDTSVQVPWARAVYRTADGLPYLAPHLQLLFTSLRPRPKDEHDARVVLPLLEAAERAELDRWLPPAHPWRAGVADAAG